MKTRFFIICTAVLMQAALSGCGGKEAENAANTEGLEALGEINAIVREEGSGTEEIFKELMNIGSDSSENTEGAEPANPLSAYSSKEVISLAAENLSAIGYVSYAAAKNSDEVKIISVDGKKPGEKRGAYPLGRPFYAAYWGRPDASARDFLNYVMGAGQETVAKDYTPAGKPVSFLSTYTEGTVTIDGSTSAALLMDKLAEEYMEINPNTKIEVTASDSSQGLKNAIGGKYDIGLSSRELRENEKELLKYRAFAYDEIALVVNPKNPIENISSSALRKIYTGEISDWKDTEETLRKILKK